MDETILTTQSTTELIGTNRTEYVVQTYQALNEVTSKPAIRILIGGMIVTIVSGLVLLLFGESEDFILSLAMIGLGLVFFPLMYLFIKKSLKKAVETNVRVNKDAVLNYQFYSDKVHVQAKSENQDGESEFSYLSFYKVVETKDYIFLYIQATVALCVNKNTFSFGKEQVIDALKLKAKKYKSISR